MEHIQPGQNVLLLWKTSGETLEFQNQVEKLKNQLQPDGTLSLENVDRLVAAKYPKSSFDAILSGILTPSTVVHDIALMGEMIRIVKLNGRVVLQEATGAEGLKMPLQLISLLKLSGFSKYSEPTEVSITAEEKAKLAKELGVQGELNITQIHCQKPNYEVGSSTPLNFAPRPVSDATNAVSDSIKSVWRLDNTVDEELMDPDDLLEEADLVKPDAASLRVCGTTGRRKACKDCSCGFAEELAGGQPAAPQAKASSCGSCYLGDAFRCASCPYLGMPAFKPGEKIQLSDRQLTADN